MSFPVFRFTLVSLETGFALPQCLDVQAIDADTAYYRALAILEQLGRKDLEPTETPE